MVRSSQVVCLPALQVLSCLYGMDIRDAELGTLERKRGGKAKKRKKRGDADDVAAAMKEADAGDHLCSVYHAVGSQLWRSSVGCHWGRGPALRASRPSLR